MGRMFPKFLTLLLAVLFVAACGQSESEKRRQSSKRRMQLLREDSAALKIAVMPTIDCLPLFVARECHLFDSLGADIRLKMFTAQMDCDTALVGGSVEGCMTDLVRAERMIDEGTPLLYVTSTNAYWQLYSNRMARIRKLNQLDDKMLAMTRYSATDLLADVVIDSAKLKSERLFRIQVNDVHIRLHMLQNNEIDAVLLSEPQATVARLQHHQLLLDSRSLPVQLGVMAFRENAIKDTVRHRQLEVLKNAYNLACDSLKRYGVGRYRDCIVKYCKINASQADSLPRDIQFSRISAPSPSEIERARKWLKQ